MKEKRAPSRTNVYTTNEESEIPLNSKLEGFFLRMRTIEVENEELKQELQSLGARAKEEASDVR
jgi:hypothetical protein